MRRAGMMFVQIDRERMAQSATVGRNIFEKTLLDIAGQVRAEFERCPADRILETASVGHV